MSYISVPVDQVERAADLRPAGGVQYAVKDRSGEYITYGDQHWVASGQALADAHPDGTIVRRTVTVTYGEWEEVDLDETPGASHDAT